MIRLSPVNVSCWIRKYLSSCPLSHILAQSRGFGSSVCDRTWLKPNGFCAFNVNSNLFPNCSTSNTSGRIDCESQLLCGGLAILCINWIVCRQLRAPLRSFRGQWIETNGKSLNNNFAERYTGWLSTFEVKRISLGALQLLVRLGLEPGIFIALTRLGHAAVASPF